MKQQFLKLAKMKDEASFYRVFPTEEAFMAKYGKQIKKLKLSDTLQKANVGTTMQSIQPSFYPRIDTQTLGGAPQMTSIIGKGLGNTPLDTKTLTIDSIPNSTTSKFNMGNLVAPATQLLKGVDTLIQEKKQMKRANQWNQISNLQLQASRMKPEDIERDYVRPEDSIISSGEMFPQYFTKNGGKIKKAKANFGANVLDFANKGGSNLASNYIQKGFDFNAGSQIGSAVGDAVKFIPGVGPIAGAIAQPLLTAIGGAIDPYAKKIKKYTNQMNNNINNMALSNGVGGVQQQYSGFMEDGGTIKQTEPWHRQALYNAAGWWEHNKPQLMKDFPITDFSVGPTLDYLSGKGGEENALAILPSIGTIGKSAEEIAAARKAFLQKTNANKIDRLTNSSKPEDEIAKMEAKIKRNAEFEKIGKRNTGKLPGEYKNRATKRNTLDFIEAKQIQRKENLPESYMTGAVREGKSKFLYSPRNKKYNDGGELQQYGMGGDLQLYDGNAELMSNNPYSPEEGNTMMLKGPSHAKGGMDIAYGGNSVEAEGGEPVMKGQDGDLTIFGNMKIGKELIPLLGDTNAKGKKFKNYIADLSREEEKTNKLKDKSVFSMSDLKIETPLDKLKANSFKYNVTGADSKLQDIAEKKQRASSLQTAMLKEAEERNIDPYKLSEGKIRKAKMGTFIPKAADGIQVPKKEGVDEATYNMMVGFYNRAKAQGRGNIVDAYQKLYYDTYPEETRRIIGKEVPSNLAKQQGILQEVLADPNTPLEILTGTNDNRFGIRTEQMFPIKPLENIEGWDKTLDRLKEITYKQQEVDNTPKSPIQTQESNNNLSRIDMLASALPYFRPTDAENLDPRQLAGEMYALSTNQLEPVQAQQYSPELSSPYEISLQDSLNEITADKRAAERMSGYNPAAQSFIASQAYGAKSKVLADQLRINQAMKDKTFGENRNILNNAKLQNLQILDNQYTRQAQAKSNTKDITQNALSSIASKFQQNELERKTLQTYENMYNYRFGDNMRAQNWNGPALFNEPTVGSLAGINKTTPAEDRKVIYDENQNMYDLVPRRKSETKSSNGSIVSAYRKL